MSRTVRSQCWMRDGHDEVRFWKSARGAKPCTSSQHVGRRASVTHGVRADMRYVYSRKGHDSSSSRGLVVDGGSLSFLSGREVHPGIAPLRASRSSGLENNMENWRRDDHQR